MEKTNKHYISKGYTSRLYAYLSMVTLILFIVAMGVSIIFFMQFQRMWGLICVLISAVIGSLFFIVVHFGEKKQYKIFKDYESSLNLEEFSKNYHDLLKRNLHPDTVNVLNMYYHFLTIGNNPKKTLNYLEKMEKPNLSKNLQDYYLIRILLENKFSVIDRLYNELASEKAIKRERKFFMKIAQLYKIKVAIVKADQTKEELLNIKGDNLFSEMIITKLNFDYYSSLNNKSKKEFYENEFKNKYPMYSEYLYFTNKK